MKMLLIAWWFTYSFSTHSGHGGGDVHPHIVGPFRDREACENGQRLLMATPRPGPDKYWIGLYHFIMSDCKEIR